MLGSMVRGKSLCDAHREGNSLGCGMGARGTLLAQPSACRNQLFPGTTNRYVFLLHPCLLSGFPFWKPGAVIPRREPGRLGTGACAVLAFCVLMLVALTSWPCTAAAVTPVLLNIVRVHKSSSNGLTVLSSPSSSCGPAGSCLLHSFCSATQSCISRCLQMLLKGTARWLQAVEEVYFCALPLMNCEAVTDLGVGWHCPLLRITFVGSCLLGHVCACVLWLAQREGQKRDVQRCAVPLLLFVGKDFCKQAASPGLSWDGESAE